MNQDGREQRVHFMADGNELEALISLPAAPARAAAVVCHPHPLYGGNMDNNVVLGLTEAFRATGVATLRFNFRGVRNSGGQHDEGRGEVADVRAAITALVERVSPERVAVAGYSFGSLVGLKAGVADPRVTHLIGVAPPLASRDFSFLAGCAKPKLLIAGDRDNHAPLAGLTTLHEGLTEPKALTILPSADHFFAGFEDAVGRAAYEFLLA